MSEETQEIELKAELEPADLAAIRSETPGESGARAQTLRSIYFDTADRRLLRAGVAWRLRRSKGRWTQTIKLGRPEGAALHTVREIETPAAAGLPALADIGEGDMRAHLEALLDGRALAPVFEIAVRRSTRLITLDGSQIEMALDQGRIIAGNAQAPITEIEFELKAGAPQAVFRCAARVLGGRAARLIQPAKSARGYALADARALPAAAVITTNVSQLDLGADAEAAFDALLRLYARAFAENLYVTLRSDDPEGPHQLRVALRRLRAMLSAFAPIIRHKARRKLRDGARRIARLASPLRDADVLIDETLAPACGEGDAETRLLAALNGWRARTRKAARAALLEERATGFALKALRLAELGAWRKKGDRHRARGRMPAWTYLYAALEAGMAGAHGYGKKISHLPAEARHELRKDLKMLRYVAEAAAHDRPSPAAQRFLATLKRLQSRLGYLNDMDALKHFSPALGERAAAKTLKAVCARVHAQAQAKEKEMLAQADKAWRALGKAEAFWRAPP